MKLILTLAFLFIAAFARATLVTFPVLDMTGATNDVTINIKAVNNPIIWNGSFYWLPNTGTNVTTTNSFGQINLIPGKYTAFIENQSQSWALNVTNSAVALPATSLSSGVTYYSGVEGLQGSGGIQVKELAPGIFVIDGTQVSGGQTGAVLYDEPGLAFTGYLLFN